MQSHSPTSEEIQVFYGDGALAAMLVEPDPWWFKDALVTSKVLMIRELERMSEQRRKNRLSWSRFIDEIENEGFGL